MRWTSDPSGSVEIVVTREADLGRYRFGTGTADFLICRQCGYLLAALGHDHEARAVINIDVLDRADEFLEASPADLDGEDVESRRARRARSWTPARLTLAG